MRKVLAFLVWLFSFWTWKDFILRWFRRSPFFPASGETAGSEHWPSQEVHRESELARFLSSIPEDERCCNHLDIRGDSDVTLRFGRNWKEYCPNMQGGYGEFLGAVASSEVVFGEGMWVYLEGDDSLKHVEAFADALRRSGNPFRKLELCCTRVSSIPLAKCISSALLGNNGIEDLNLRFGDLSERMGKEVAAEFVAIVGVPHVLRTLKLFRFDCSNLDDKGVEKLMKCFYSPSCVLEELNICHVSSDAQLEHVGGLLAASTSLKELYVDRLNDQKKKECTRGYTSIASALCSNQSLEFLNCDISSSMELKALLDPLMPKTNNLQPNTTLTHLWLRGTLGGKEGIEAIVDMLHTNLSLLDLSFRNIHDLNFKGAQGVQNILAILEALKTNKTLKMIGFDQCSAIGGYRVLGAMMDLLLENHCIEKIDLGKTPLKDSGDAEYIESALSKRRKMKLWSIVQDMANVKTYIWKSVFVWTTICW